MSAKDTPRAFPSVAIADEHGGMTLRDAFALSAVGGLAQNADFSMYPDRTAQRIAERAFIVADQMMAERERTKK